MFLRRVDEHVYTPRVPCPVREAYRGQASSVAGSNTAAHPLLGGDDIVVAQPGRQPLALRFAPRPPWIGRLNVHSNTFPAPHKPARLRLPSRSRPPLSSLALTGRPLRARECSGHPAGFAGSRILGRARFSIRQDPLSASHGSTDATKSSDPANETAYGSALSRTPGSPLLPDSACSVLRVISFATSSTSCV